MTAKDCLSLTPYMHLGLFWEILLQPRRESHLQYGTSADKFMLTINLFCNWPTWAGDVYAYISSSSHPRHILFCLHTCPSNLSMSPCKGVTSEIFCQSIGSNENRLPKDSVRVLEHSERKHESRINPHTKPNANGFERLWRVLWATVDIRRWTQRMLLWIYHRNL